MTTLDEALDQQARPEGQPGTVARQRGTAYGWSYPAVQMPDGTVAFWRDSENTAGRWIVAPPGLAASFEAGPDWQADCPHENNVPWRPSDSEADCVAMKREGR
jgi:hypothetical protein